MADSAMSDPRCAYCGRILEGAYPPFCPGHWRALPAEIGDRVRGEAVAITSRAETETAAAAIAGAVTWLNERDSAAAAVTARRLGETPE